MPRGRETTNYGLDPNPNKTYSGGYAFLLQWWYNDQKKIWHVKPTNPFLGAPISVKATLYTVTIYVGWDMDAFIWSSIYDLNFGDFLIKRLFVD